ncbi:MAG: helix-turn-helix transcriptional regulator [Clostridiaceae bacterium]|nr:helix-turn-helix transcriptional regulator [Clostridiaceae bacterium]
MRNQAEDAYQGMAKSFQMLFDKEELLAKVIECFPYPIQIYALDGTSVMVNKAMLAEYKVISPDMVVGKYNIFVDPYIIASGQMPKVKRAFKGETVVFHDIRVPLENIAERYGVKDLDLEAVYQDITLFPILNDKNQVVYVAALLINRRVYRGNDEITRAKEYIETHWLEPFDLSATAKAVRLSRAHFAKLFKKHTGMTPHEYYINYKIKKLKEKLLDTNLSISQAFAACNMNYSGHSARLFKEKVGVSPSEYRKMLE